jgi:hypothetical protein
MSEPREKFDVDGERIEDGQQVVLVREDEGGIREAVLLLEIADLQPHAPMLKVKVVQLLEHEDAPLFTVGESFEALSWHLSRGMATMAVSGDE